MGMKMFSPAFLFIIFLMMEFAIFSCGKNSSFDCIPWEGKALLTFKASLLDPSNRLSSWNNFKDCCAWDGVKCDTTTGHVISLNLRNSKTEDYNAYLQGNQLDYSLSELKYLSYLDLSYNDFQFSPIPAFLGSMKQLQYLNLSIAGFYGIVPHDLGNLSNLRTLGLSSIENLIVDDLIWASNLSSLENLDLSYINLGQTKNLVNVLNMLPFLSILRLSECSLDNTNLAHTCVNSTLFTHIQNQFYGEISGLLKNLSECWIDKLEEIRLYGNKFFGNLPEDVGELKRLKYLDLSSNTFNGSIPWSLGKLSSLTNLDISFNKLSGSIPSSLGNMRSLRVLNSGSNQLRGEIFMSLGQLSNLESIDISFNFFNDTLLEAHFASLSKLEFLWASSNLFKFKVGLDWAPPFQLKSLGLQSCIIGGQFPQWLQNQKALDNLDLSNCSISGSLPSWLQYINLTILDLSRNHIEGSIPKPASSMRFLFLSNNMINHLPRNIGHMMPFLNRFSLDGNFVNGSIPESLCEMKALRFLDLSNNYLSGNLPDFWENFVKLNAMRLSSNKLSGIIPNSIGEAYSLQWLHLNNNSLTGQFPYSLKNCTKLVLLDVGGNKLSGNLPDWIGKYLPYLRFLILRNNEFYGMISPEFCQLSQLQVMDFAYNKLTENIPHCIGNFSGMITNKSINSTTLWPRESLGQVMKGVEQEYTASLVYVVNLDVSNNNLVGEIPLGLTNLSGLIGLNLSHNHLEGNIPTKIGDLKSLISLDFSSNNLFGTIPDSLSDLSFLSHLNLSHNNFSGRIPTGNQLQTLDNPSIYDGNPQLCGALLHKKCNDDEAPNVENHAATREDDRAEKIYLYGVIISGSAIGFWGIIGVLIFKRSWRQAYFGFIEVGVGKMLGW
ncbi:hypothetical protein BUALT_Bualt07G0049400 [Buddleja alternifolia]|uniref:Leucine-rich repeat-containing N-terminal plant-type domain-containing protein n=1 Tax=Buddleja alternifolia TaxID=168488 RepID=A0AAV6X829_9LAMI|nr:hypothetical protein BUALT_Bualt07G0049400 [Buddleja alternifolia]